MQLYSFYPCRPDGNSSSIETFVLRSDLEAPGFALKVLSEHASCSYVTVWHEDRPVLTQGRFAPGAPLDRT